MTRPLGGNSAIPNCAQWRMSSTLLPLRSVARRVANASQHSHDAKCSSICMATGSSTPAITSETDAAVTALVPAGFATYEETTDLTTIVDIANWIRKTYPAIAYSKADVLSKVERAQGALQRADPSRLNISLQRDILPKAQVRQQSI